MRSVRSTVSPGRVLVVGCLGAALATAACGDVDAGPGVRSAGAGPQRVLSLVPDATTLLLALDVGEHLVGRTEADTDPRLEALPSVGRVLAPDPERIAALRPDLLIAWRGADTAALRRALPSDAVLVTTGVERLADVVPTLQRLAAALGPPAQARARALARRWDEARGGLPNPGASARPRVLWVVWSAPLTVAGPGSHVHDLLRWAGGRNVVPPTGGAWPTLSWEAAAALAPDVVVWGDAAGVPDPRDRPGPWRAVGAVEAGRVLVVAADTFHVPGLHSPAAARRLAREIRYLAAGAR